ncbi:hypothetical protein H7F38_23110 [Nakamurella sp. PAMC28650]|nr:hypothetical protein [Nakamurella sp. PAMC28650]QNK84054.1 hypothetical protein H7F38_23110 [Nakamurella sp. PAMC28650]
MNVLTSTAASVQGYLATGGNSPSDVDPTTGKGPEWGEAAPIGLLVIVLLCVAVYFLVKSMNRNLKKVPKSFATVGAPVTVGASASAMHDGSLGRAAAGGGAGDVGADAGAGGAGGAGVAGDGVAGSGAAGTGAAGTGTAGDDRPEPGPTPPASPR